MVTLEIMKGPEELVEVQSKLEHHWMLDATVANEMAQGLTAEGTEHIDELLHSIEQQAPAIQKRDENRAEVRKIFNGVSDKQLIILGPCSLDADTDYTELFNYIEEMQQEHPDVVFGVRLNGAKPRSRGGNTGSFMSTVPGRRKKQMDAYDDAFSRGIAIFTEITDKDQFGMLAPYLAGAWLGARDMASTDLRTLFSATRLNVLIKNASDGKIGSLKDAVEAIGKNTEQADDSGVNLGNFASTCKHEHGGPAVFTVGEGNKNVALVARGYELDDEVFDGKTIRLVDNLTEQEREAKTLHHLGEVCMLAALVGRKALLDGSHEVPRMLKIDKSDGSRFLQVLHRFRKAAKEGEISNVEMIRGYLGEVSVNEGITDKNLVLTEQTKAEINEEVREFKKMDKLLFQLSTYQNSQSDQKTGADQNTALQDNI